VTRDARWALPASRPVSRFEGLRDPVRATVLGASIGFIVGARLTWVNAVLPYVPRLEVSGFDNAGDGAITLVAALFTVGWALSASAFRSRAPVLVLFPLVIGIAALVLTRLAIQNAEILIASYEKRGGSGSISIGLWLTGIAALVMTVAGLAHVLRVRRDVSFRVRLVAGDVGAVAGGILGGFAGIVASTTLVSRFVVTDMAAVVASTQVLILLPLAFIGAWIGAKVGRMIAEALRPMPPAGP